MKRIMVIITALVGLLITMPLFAWGFKEHVLVAEMAYENLSPHSKTEINRLSSIIYDHLSKRKKDRLNRYYKNVSPYAKIAVLPDGWRRWKLKTIFHHFGAPIPASLESLQYKRTGNWHFINQPFPNTSCHTVKPKNVVWALQKVRYAFVHDSNENAKVVLLVMLTHWVGDANQPLHTLSHVNGQCKDDKGGNLFCLTKNKGGYCRHNLHHLWDYAVGYLNGRKNLKKEAARLQSRYPKNAFEHALMTSPPNQWVKQGYRYAPFIYSTPEYQKPAPNYYRQGQKIAQKQMVLASDRLSFILGTILK